MFILMLEHKLWTTATGTWYYEDQVTWVAAVLVIALLGWFFLSSYLRARPLRRRPRPANYRLLKEVVSKKRGLSSQYLRPGFSGNIHAVGIGRLGSDYCIQVFISNANEELWPGLGAAALPNSYRGVPVLLIEMPMAGFLSTAAPPLPENWDSYPKGIRDPQEVIVGGISGANTNLTGESGTIGYFCTRKSKLRRRKEIHLLSNSHVFADLRKTKVDPSDLIMQPSPGEPASSRPIGTLVSFSALKFDAGLDAPNQIDAAIAKLWAPQPHQPLIPLIGAVKGCVATKDVAIGEAVRKFGRTTGYTEGQLFSIHLDIWIRYDRTGQKAFFQDQFLIEPALPHFARFVSRGDSGSLLVDAEQQAIGLIFAGMSELGAHPNSKPVAEVDPAADRPKRIESYGVANPICDVLDGLSIELLI